jgi:cytochrome c-type biogenesis protein CcmH
MVALVSLMRRKSSAAPLWCPDHARNRVMVSLASMAILSAAVGILSFMDMPPLGTPSSLAGSGPGTPMAEAPPAAPAPSLHAGDLNLLVERLEARLKREPADAQGWALFARTQMELQRYSGSILAYTRASAMLPQDADLRAELATAAWLANNRRWNVVAIDATRAALLLDPRHPEALWLAGSQQFDKKDYTEAVRFWEKLAAIAPADSAHGRTLPTSLAEARALRDGKDPSAAIAAIGQKDIAGPLPTASTAMISSAPDTPNRSKQQLAHDLQSTIMEMDRAKMSGAAAGEAKALAMVHIGGIVSIHSLLSGKVSADDAIFVFARADGADRSTVPLAARRYRVADLPIRFELSDNDAMSPQATLSAAKRVVVTARISKSGDARAQVGDLEGTSQAVPVGNKQVSILIDKTL